MLTAMQVLISECALNAEAIRQLGHKRLIAWMGSKWGLEILRAEVKDQFTVLMRGTDEDVGISARFLEPWIDCAVTPAPSAVIDMWRDKTRDIPSCLWSFKVLEVSLHHPRELLFTRWIRTTRERWSANRSGGKPVPCKPLCSEVPSVRHKEVIIEPGNKLSQELWRKPLRGELAYDLITRLNTIELHDNGSELWHERERRGGDTDRTLNNERVLPTEILNPDVEGPAEFGAGEGSVHAMKRAYRRILDVAKKKRRCADARIMILPRASITYVYKLFRSLLEV
jgi:hypothetical protein